MIGRTKQLDERILIEHCRAVAQRPDQLSMRAAAAVFGVDRQKSKARIADAIERATLAWDTSDRGELRRVTDFVGPIPPGHSVLGISTLRKTTIINDDGEEETVTQWVKTGKDKPSDKNFIDAAEAVLEGRVPIRLASTTFESAASRRTIDVIHISDMHIGMHAWSQETGSESYNLDRASFLLIGAIDELTLRPLSRHLVIKSHGDLLHADFRTPKTEASGHQVDADTRWFRVVAKAIDALVAAIDIGLCRYEKVTVVLQQGNHDYHTSSMLQFVLSAHFRNEPRVDVVVAAQDVKALRFGDVFLALTHGQYVKKEGANLALAIAADFARWWGITRHRYVHSGHVHHDFLKEFPGILHETHAVLAPKDVYAAFALYRAGRRIKMITYDGEHGEAHRKFVDVGMIGADLVERDFDFEIITRMEKEEDK